MNKENETLERKWFLHIEKAVQELTFSLISRRTKKPERLKKPIFGSETFSFFSPGEGGGD